MHLLLHYQLSIRQRRLVYNMDFVVLLNGTEAIMQGLFSFVRLCAKYTC